LHEVRLHDKGIAEYFTLSYSPWKKIKQKAGDVKKAQKQAAACFCAHLQTTKIVAFSLAPDRSTAAGV
jgi:hypothetical protein